MKIKPNNFFYFLFFDLLMVLLVIYSCEGILRFADPKRHLPFQGFHNGKLYNWGHLINENSNHFRDKEFGPRASVKTYRIMVMGDSFTYGEGVDESARYTNLLEAHLQKEFPTIPMEVLNFGIRGIPTTFERDLLQAWAPIINPDLIVVGFCVNDPQPRPEDFSVEQERLRQNLAAVRKFLLFLGCPLLTEKIEKGAESIAEKWGKVPTWPVALDRTYNRDSQEWKDFEQALKDIKKISDARRLPPPIFAVLTQAVYKDRPTNYNKPDALTAHFLRWYEQADRTAREDGFQVVNFLNDVSDSFPNEILAVNILDGHPSEKLHMLYATKLFTLVKENIRSRHH